jgi:hypothetical protein
LNLTALYRYLFSGNVIGIHGENPKVTPGKADFQSVQVIGDTAKYPLVKIHGKLLLMTTYRSSLNLRVYVSQIFKD